MIKTFQEWSERERADFCALFSEYVDCVLPLTTWNSGFEDSALITVQKRFYVVLKKLYVAGMLLDLKLRRKTAALSYSEKGDFGFAIGYVCEDAIGKVAQLVVKSEDPEQRKYITLSLLKGLTCEFKNYGLTATYIDINDRELEHWLELVGFKPFSPERGRKIYVKELHRERRINRR